MGYKYLTFVNTCELPRRVSCDPYGSEFTCVCVYVWNTSSWICNCWDREPGIFYGCMCMSIPATTILFNLTPAEQLLHDSTNYYSSFEKIFHSGCLLPAIETNYREEWRFEFIFWVRTREIDSLDGRWGNLNFPKTILTHLFTETGMECV